MPVGEQVAILYCGTKGLMASIPLEKVRECQDLFLDIMRNKHQDILEELGNGKIDDNCTAIIEETISNIAGQYK